MNKSSQQLQVAVEAARKKRLKTLGIDIDGMTEPGPDSVLLGQCPHNAVTLARLLVDQWSNGRVSVQPGYLDIPGTQLPDGSGSPNVFETARQRGLLHFWVMAEDERAGEIYHCDIARETPKHHRRDRPTGPTAGTPMVDPDQPEGYLPVSEDYTIDDLDTGDCPFDLIVLWNAIRRARDAYLDQWEITEEENDRIDGYCHEHAEILLKTLAESWDSCDAVGQSPTWQGTNTARRERKTPYVQFGGAISHMNSEAPAESVDAIDTVNAEGCGHYWVVAPLEANANASKSPTDIRQYTADIYGHTEGRSGNPLLVDGRPHDYRPVEDGLVPAGMVRQVDDWWQYHL